MTQVLIKKVYVAMYNPFFLVFDANVSRFLEGEECALLFAYAGFQNTGIARRVFDATCIDQSGKPSVEWFSTALIEYFMQNSLHWIRIE